MRDGHGKRVKVYFFTMVLSRSRYKFVYHSLKPFTSALAIYAHMNVSSLDNLEIKTSPLEGMMILGEKIENPYSVVNMKKAFESLKNSYEYKSISKADLNITTTHLYLRILPKNADEVNWFIEDTTMEMFDYPLDYEIIKEGNFYQDSEIPLGNPTWLYTTVPIDFVLPDMKIEILDECYIPDYDNFTIKSTAEN